MAGANEAVLNGVEEGHSNELDKAEMQVNNRVNTMIAGVAGEDGAVDSAGETTTSRSGIVTPR